MVSRAGCNTSGIMEVVLSIRRVKKGPGRRPQSAKRQKVMELRVYGPGTSLTSRCHDLPYTLSFGGAGGAAAGVFFGLPRLPPPW